MTDESRPTILLIHGLWLNALSWEHWVERYKQRGYKVIGCRGPSSALAFRH
jgi:alpha-beta hydrolase superfamily lysophospholipase